MRATLVLATSAATLVPVAALAAATVTYSYDAKGRLSQVAHAGGPTAGVMAIYTLDHADNRTAIAVTGAWLDGSGRPVGVVHAGRWKVVPLSNLQP